MRARRHHFSGISVPNDRQVSGDAKGGDGKVGDGKIFVLDLADCVRISSDERGGKAIG